MGGIDPYAILASLTNGRGSALDDWLSEDPERAANFWIVIEGANRKRNGIDKALAAWNAASEAAGEPDFVCPVKYNQVRIALRR